MILLSLVGLPDGDGRNRPIGDVVDGVIDDVAEMQLLGAGFRPVFLLDTPAFGRARSYGYVAELVTPAQPGRPNRRTGRVCRCSDCIDEDQLGVSAVITIARMGSTTSHVLRSFG